MSAWTIGGAISRERPELVQERSLLLRLSLVVLGTGTLVFGAISLVAPNYAFTQLGFSDLNDAGLFEGSFLGAVMVPWGAGLVLAGRRHTRGTAWAALGLTNAVAAIVVLVFFLGKGTISAGGVWPLIAVYGIGLIGTAVFGHRELRGRGEVHMVEPVRESQSAQESYRVDLEAESDQGDSSY